uniref:COMM domain-containing protein n=1 Tax=Haemonchus contortus TaxID=6289 RepID=A0A7I4YRZ4_HAECO
MSQPQLPDFPPDLPEVDTATVEKIARFALDRALLLENRNEKPEMKVDLESFGLSPQEFDRLLSFFTGMWAYFIYHRLGGQSLSNVLESLLPPSYVEVVTAIWYSDGPSVYTHLARRTASNIPRVQDVSWSIWSQTASDYTLEKNDQHGIRLDIETDKGIKPVFLTSSQVAKLHSETVWIQTEIDKLLE